ncbi:MAG: hypothetical protein ABI882_07685 [Acidobacteriota bacterium]
MIPHWRARFNTQFTDEKYRAFVKALEDEVSTRIEFRPCETPVFLPRDLLDEMVAAGKEIISQLSTEEYLRASDRALPPAFTALNEGNHPDFIQVDFAVTRDSEGRLTPKLIELQGCASLYAFQMVLPSAYRRFYDLGDLTTLIEGLTENEYLELFRNVILAGHSPEQVILMEIEPGLQKTLPDFVVTERLLGIRTVCISEVIKRGTKLFYSDNGQEREIRRIYNRVIVDELITKGTQYAFDFRDALDVEWAGHPNWFFRFSKFSLPFLRHPTVPRAWFLNELDQYPADLEHFVLKPLFSFAGAGVKVEITRQDLEAVPEHQRGEFLLQEKITYAPVIETPDEPSKVEVRLMFLWPQGEDKPRAVTTLTRLSKGLMLGVDFNKNKTWVGSSCAFFER